MGCALCSLSSWPGTGCLPLPSPAPGSLGYPLPQFPSKRTFGQALGIAPSPNASSVGAGCAQGTRRLHPGSSSPAAPPGFRSEHIYSGGKGGKGLFVNWKALGRGAEHCCLHAVPFQRGVPNLDAKINEAVLLALGGPAAAVRGSKCHRGTRRFQDSHGSTLGSRRRVCRGQGKIPSLCCPGCVLRGAVGSPGGICRAAPEGWPRAGCPLCHKGCLRMLRVRLGSLVCAPVPDFKPTSPRSFSGPGLRSPGCGNVTASRKMPPVVLFKQ